MICAYNGRRNRSRRTLVSVFRAIDQHIVLPLLLSACLALPACKGQPPEPAASLVVTDARVWTGDPGNPWAEAVASDGERLVAVGSNEEIRRLAGDVTEVISVAGSMLVPGFIDTHVHFVDGGAGLASVQLRDAATPEEFTRRIGAFAAGQQPGEWMLIGTWDHENWGGELPRRDWIDAVTPDNPVWINRLDGHMALANSLALKLAGVDADTPDVAGGEIVRDPDGRPTGILKDNAMSLMSEAVPAASASLLDRQVAAAMRYVAANGVTTVHEMATEEAGWANLDAFRRARANGSMITRIYAAVPLPDWERMRDEVEARGRGDDWLRIGGLKAMMDGSLGSHTAAFLEPYTDAPEQRGLLIHDLADVKTWVAGADAAGLQIMVHAIGDRAIRDILDIYLDVADANGQRDRRFRIEHAQHIHPDDLPRFAVQNVIASMQPYHAIDDGRWADRVIGKERARTTYAFRSLIDSGAHVAFGSDWYVAPATPIDGIYAAVTRRTLDDANPGGWVPEQKITVEQALHAYTYEGAYASFEEGVKGTLKPGMLADFVLLDRDLTAIPPETIRDTKILRTVVGGRVVYSADTP
jgi:predicted amidohydrolase YtcJ